MVGGAKQPAEINRPTRVKTIEHVYVIGLMDCITDLCHEHNGHTYWSPSVVRGAKPPAEIHFDHILNGHTYWSHQWFVAQSSPLKSKFIRFAMDT